MIYLSLGVFVILLFIDLPQLIAKKDRKELMVYAVLSGITLLYLTRYALGMEIFSPIKVMSSFVQKALKLSYELWQGHS